MTSTIDREPLIRATRLLKRYSSDAPPAVRDIDLAVRQGEWIALLGRSGSGKSTLLNLLAGLDRATEGELFVVGEPLHRRQESELDAWRGRHIGIVFQFFQLLPSLTALENVLLAMDFVGAIPAKRRRDRALALLDMLELGELDNRLPEQLSGGQQQRVAVARALANDPALVLADEPTGNLDEASAALVMRALHACVEQGKTVVLVTHDRDLASQASRVLRIIDGRLTEAARS